jgi:tetratricopeptide (TPR) repeat protein
LLSWFCLMLPGFLRTIFLLILPSINLVSYATPGFAGLVQGPYNVGFRVVSQYDYARTYKDATDGFTGKPTVGERARPIQTLVWYPAAKGGTPLRYADYLRTEATDEVLNRPAPEVAAFLESKRQWTVNRVGAKQAQLLFEQRMWAVADAPAAAGKFPVVLYAPGRSGTAHELADLGEYLASQGYVVLASRSLGTRTPLMNTDLEGLTTQARDLQFLLAYAHTLPQADLGHVAAVGWSWGGLANVLAATQDSRISALVSFDGTREPTLTKPLSPTRLTVPWLYIQRRAQTVSELSRQGIETSFSLLNEVKYANVYQLVMHPMEHVDFSSALLRTERPGYFAEYSRAEVEAAYYWTCHYTLEFLNAYLKGSAASRTFLDQQPVRNGAPAHMATMQHTPALAGALPTQAGYAAALAQQGFDHALEVYRQVQQQNPAFSLSAEDLNGWGYNLLNEASNRPAARAIFRLGTQLYPTDANLFDSLAEADELNKDPQAAIAHYRRSLELNPQNANARQHLQALGGPVGASTN